MRDLPRAGLAWYYLATPLFAVLDLGAGWPVRVAGLGDPVHRALYYLAVTALGVAVARWPWAAPWAGMAESSTNLLLLCLSVLLPVWSLPDQVLAGGSPAVAGAPALVNVALSGTVLVVAFHRHRRAAFGAGLRGRGGPS